MTATHEVTIHVHAGSNPAGVAIEARRRSPPNVVVRVFVYAPAAPFRLPGVRG